MECFLVCLLILFVSIVVWYCASEEFFRIAQEKGYDDRKYFWYTFFLGVCGMLMVIALPDRRNNQTIEKELLNYLKQQRMSVEKTVSGAQPKTANSAHKKEESVENSLASAAYTSTGNGTIICTLCRFEQPSNRKVCWHCGAKFEKESEQFAEHRWMCNNCKQMRTQTPCEYCGTTE